jgi:hypothetical protein
MPGDLYKVVVVDNLDNSSEESLRRVKALTGCDPSRLQFRQCDIRDKARLKEGKGDGRVEGIKKIGRRRVASKNRIPHVLSFQFFVACFWYSNGGIPRN